MLLFLIIAFSVHSDFLADFFSRVYEYFYPEHVEVFVPLELPEEEEEVPSLTYEQKLTIKRCLSVLVVSVCGAVYCL